MVSLKREASSTIGSLARKLQTIVMRCCRSHQSRDVCLFVFVRSAHLGDVEGLQCHVADIPTLKDDCRTHARAPGFDHAAVAASQPSLASDHLTDVAQPVKIDVSHRR